MIVEKTVWLMFIGEEKGSKDGKTGSLGVQQGVEDQEEE